MGDVNLPPSAIVRTRKWTGITGSITTIITIAITTIITITFSVGGSVR
jgi:hypothetical protein